MNLYSVDELIQSIEEESLPRTDSRRELRLEIKYYNNEYGSIRSFIELKIGEGKLHAVKNMKAFLSAVEHKQTLEFTKNFSYNPLIHRFNEQDTKMLDILEEINSADEGHSFRFSEYGGSSTLIAGKRAAMPDKQLVKLLKLFKGQRIDAVIKGQEQQSVSIYEAQMPLRFHLKFSGEDIRLSYEGEIPFQLDGSFKVFWFNKSIYLPTEEQLRIYKPLYSLLNKDYRGIVFSNNDYEKVMKDVISSLKKIAIEIKINKECSD